MRSLRVRVLLSTAAVLTLFILLTGLALEQAFRDSARSAREERLLAQVYLLMAAAESVDDILRLPDKPPEPRFELPASGLYGAVLDDTGNPVWRSASMLGLDIPLGGPLPPGQRRFERADDAQGQGYLTLGFGVRWATGAEPAGYTFVVAEDLAPFRQELARFRVSLAGWLGAMSLLLLAVLLLSLHWGLAPLRRVATEVSGVESGQQDRIRGDYPVELRALTDNLNALLAHERTQHKRLDNALGDLAHSLKTPLAIMRGALDPRHMDPEAAELMDEQLARADEMVDYQLQRARSGTGSAAGLAAPVELDTLVQRLIVSLSKLHAHKVIRVERQIPPGLTFRGAEGDLMEVLGNLLDNAWKWSCSRILVAAERERGMLSVRVEDDGPGIPAAQLSAVLERGARADSAVAGHGIGLAMVREICEAYGGAVEIARGRLGGARVEARLLG